MAKKDTQHIRILRYLREFGSITTLQAFTDLGITKLTTRISEMRRMGIAIDGTRVAVKNRFDETCHINRYTLIDTKTAQNQTSINKAGDFPKAVHKHEILDDSCVCCGTEIPEGRQICLNCEGV